MADRIGAPRATPATVSSRLHRDIGPQRRLEPRRGDHDLPWLDGLASYPSLRRLVQILDPLVLLANLGGFAVTEIVVAADPSRSDKVLGIVLPEIRFEQGVQPGTTTATFWRVYLGVDFPVGATFALGLRMQVERFFGTVYYDPGVAVDFADPSMVPWPHPDDDAPLFDRLLLLSSPDALTLDDWLPVLADVVADDGGLRSRLIADLVAAAHRVATATTPVVPAGQLSLYAPSRWRPPQRGRPAEEQQDYLDPFVQVGYAMAEHVLPDPDALGRFLVEETRLSRRVLRSAGAVPATAQPRVSLRSRLRQIDQAVGPRPRLLGLARRCEQETRREPADPLVALDTWTVPRPGLRAVDLRLSYTEWLLVASQLGVIDPVTAIGVDAAVADPVSSRGLHPWLPGGLSRHATHIRGLASSAWMNWEIDRPRALAYLARIVALLPAQPPTYELRWHGMPDSQLTRSFPAMQSWAGTELDDARAMIQDLVEDQGALDGDAMFTRLRELELVLPGLDEYWLQTEAVTGPLEELREMAGELGEGFAEGFLVPFEGDPLATASRLWDLHQVNAPYLPLLSNVVVVGALYGAGEHVVSTVNQLFDWVLTDAIEQSIYAMAELLDNSSSELGRLFGEATGMMAKEAAEKLLAAVAPGWYAFELGRLLGPMLLDVVLGAVFAGYVVPQLASGAAFVLRGTVEALDGVVDLRRTWAAFDRHTDTPDGGDVPDGDSPAPPPPGPLDRLGQVLPAERAGWIQTGLAASNLARILAVLSDPTRVDTLLGGLRVLSEATPDEAVFRALVRAYSSSGVKLGIPETLGRVAVKATPSHPSRGLVAADFELPTPPPSPSVEEVQQQALEVIARNANSYEELNELSSPMGPARNGNDKDLLQDTWLRNKEALGRRLVGDHELDADLWDNGQQMPVERPPGQPRTEGRVRASRMNAAESSRPEQVEGWLSHTTADDLPSAVAREVRDVAGLAYPTDASHLFPKSLGGPPELWNLVAASGRFNKSWMAWTENRLRSLFAEHGELYLRIDVTWGKDNLPTSLTYRAYKRADHGGPELVYTDVITDLRPQVSLGKTVIEPRLAGDIEMWARMTQLIGET